MSDQGPALAAQVIALAELVTSAANAWLTRGMLHETARMRRAQTEPEVIVYLEQSSRAFQTINLVVRNVGAGTAYRVRLHVVGNDWKTLRDRTISDLGLVRTGVDVLGAGDAIRTVAGDAVEIGKRADMAFTLRVTYADRPDGADRSEYFRLDAAGFRNTIGYGDPPDAVTARAITRIADRFNRLGTSTDRIHVNLWTRVDREREYATCQAMKEEESDGAAPLARSDSTPTVPRAPSEATPERTSPELDGSAPDAPPP